MSARTKARVVGALLVAIALWPLVHRQLVTRLDVDPWKLFGFAMYCTPHAVVVDVVDRGGETPRRIDPQSFPPALRESHARYSLRRSTLGTLVPPAGLAEEIFAAQPELRRITVAVRIFTLEPFASELSHRTRLYAFERPAP